MPEESYLILDEDSDRRDFGLVRSYESMGFVAVFGGWNAPYKIGDRTAGSTEPV